MTSARRVASRIRLALLACALLVPFVVPTVGSTFTPEVEKAPGTLVPIVSSGQVESTRVAAQHHARTAQSATFIVNYDSGFDSNPAAKAAFQYAVDIWSTQLTSSVPIVIDAHWTALDPGVLGSAGSTYVLRNFSGAPVSNTFYPAALANKLAGRDLFTAESDINANFSSDANWYFGTDGATPATQTDFVSVVMHEIGHGLGFSGSASVTSGLGTYGIGSSGNPMVYDRSVVDGTGLSVLSLTKNTTVMGTYLLGSNNLYWSGTNGVANNGGTRPRLYAPRTWSQGSSYSHLDENTYRAGDPNSLMTPAIGDGESIHDPGPIVRGMFTDMGWSIEVAPAPTNTPAATNTPTNTPTRTPTAVQTQAPSATPTLSAYPAPATATPNDPAASPSVGRVLVPVTLRSGRNP